MLTREAWYKEALEKDNRIQQLAEDFIRDPLDIHKAQSLARAVLRTGNPNALPRKAYERLMGRIRFHRDEVSPEEYQLAWLYAEEVQGHWLDTPHLGISLDKLLRSIPSEMLPTLDIQRTVTAYSTTWDPDAEDLFDLERMAEETLERATQSYSASLENLEFNIDDVVWVDGIWAAKGEVTFEIEEAPEGIRDLTNQLKSEIARGRGHVRVSTEEIPEEPDITLVRLNGLIPLSDMPRPPQEEVLDQQTMSLRLDEWLSLAKSEKIHYSHTESPDLMTFQSWEMKENRTWVGISYSIQVPNKTNREILRSWTQQAIKRA